MKTPLLTLYTSQTEIKQSNAHPVKTLLLSDKHTFATARAELDFDYNGCYNADDDSADYTPSVKAVRIA